MTIAAPFRLEGLGAEHKRQARRLKRFGALTRFCARNGFAGRFYAGRTSLCE